MRPAAMPLLDLIGLAAMRRRFWTSVSAETSVAAVNWT